MDVKATFTRKMGPLPMWAWALLAGGGIGLYLRHRATANAAQTTTNQTQAPAGTQAGDVTSPTSDAYASGIPGDYAGYGGQYAGTTPADLIGAVEQGIQQYVTDNPVSTGDASTQPGPADGSGVGPAPIPIAVTISGLPGEMQGGGPPAPTTRRSQVRPRPPAVPTIPRGTSPDRADNHVIHNGVDEGTLNAAMSITGRPGYPRVERSTMADRMRRHPDWGPYTLAHNGQVRGHSTRF